MQIAYTEQYEQQRGKGSFPAMITPGYHLAKKAQENASNVSINLTATLISKTNKLSAVLINSLSTIFLIDIRTVGLLQ